MRVRHHYELVAKQVTEREKWSLWIALVSKLMVLESSRTLMVRRMSRCRMHCLASVGQVEEIV